MSETLEEAVYSMEALSAKHDRLGFSCGVPALDRYLQKQARQDRERDLATVFVLTPDSVAIAGFYTLSASSINGVDLPEEFGKKLPRFPLPATLLGRMAVGRSLHGQHLGRLLLTDALERAWRVSRQIASLAVIVDAKEGSGSFYRKYGFRELPQKPSRLFLPMDTVGKFVASELQ